MKRKHSELIKAWADGAEVEYKSGNNWYKAYSPSWDDEYEYRIKPEPKPDSIKYMTVEAQDGKYSTGLITRQRYYDNNIKLTFDGETGKLKAAEMIGD